MEFGELLRQFREQAGLSQNALARAAGIDPTSLNRTERSKQGPPRQVTLTKLVRAFGWSLTDERAQQLFTAAGYGSKQTRSSTVLASPLRVTPRREQTRPIAPVLRELRLTLLRAVELIGELEELTAACEELS